MRFTSIFPLLAVLGVSHVWASTIPDEPQDIICHGKHCYPRIFQASNEFQVVQEDQVIPKGLHVRMDFNTGLKEAKLYDGHEEAALQAVEVFQDGIVEEVQPVPSPAEGLQFQPDTQQVLKSDKADQGVIRPPPSGPDGVGFSKNTATITSAATDSEALLPALENLEDLSHDIYWGLRLGQNEKVVYRLNELIGDAKLDYPIRSAAALLLGTAIQNNPAALTAALSHFYNDRYPEGPLETVMFALIHEQIPALTIRLVYLLSELCQDQAQLLHFIRGDGLAILRHLYDADNTSQQTSDRLKQKISNFVLDHFLREDSLQGLTVATSTVTPQKSKSGHLSGHIEDSWTIIDKTDVPLSNDEQDLRNMRLSLSRWCGPFSRTLEAWKADTANSEAQTAKEHVQEASESLSAKLTTFGCSCKDVKSCET